MTKIIHNLLDFLFPRLCPVCGNRLSEHEQHICLLCLTQIPRTGNYKQKDNNLEQLFAGRIPFERIASFAHFVKGGTIQPIIHELKYNNNPQIGIYIGELCGKELNESDFIKGIDYIVPIPLHPKRQEERGYNQAAMLAFGISKQTGVCFEKEVVTRTKNNPSQAKSKSREARWKNVEDIFALTDKEKFEGRHILLIDDVLTTGSTLESCAKTILQCPGTKISIYTLASVD